MLNKIVKARKPHKCWWCAEPIPAGSTCAAWPWFDMGRAFTIRVHPECLKAWNSLHRDDADNVMSGDYCRGCTCERGRCECVAEKMAVSP